MKIRAEVIDVGGDPPEAVLRDGEMRLVFRGISFDHARFLARNLYSRVNVTVDDGEHPELVRAEVEDIETALPEVGWLIEHNPGKGAPIKWLAGMDESPDLRASWTYDSIHAIRFCRRSDAHETLRILVKLGLLGREQICVVTEHRWG